MLEQRQQMLRKRSGLTTQEKKRMQAAAAHYIQPETEDRSIQAELYAGRRDHLSFPHAHRQVVDLMQPLNAIYTRLERPGQLLISSLGLPIRVTRA